MALPKAVPFVSRLCRRDAKFFENFPSVCRNLGVRPKHIADGVLGGRAGHGDRSKAQPSAANGVARVQASVALVGRVLSITSHVLWVHGSLPS